ncbi:MAG: type II secretion system F family protein [Bdellovibrionota bacterium]
MFAFQNKQLELARAKDLLGGYFQEEQQQVLSSELERARFSFVNNILTDFYAANLSKADYSEFIKKQVLVLLLVLIASLVFRTPLVLVGSPAFFWLSLLRIKIKASQRSRNFEKDYTALLLSLSSSVRTGMDPLFALCESRKMFSVNSVVSQELEKLNNAVTSGTSEFEAIQSFAASIKHPDIKLFRTAFILARMEGSSLSECLQRLARVTRQRQSFRRKIKGAVAMQKLSALGIAGCTIVIGLIQFLSNPKALNSALAHPVGSKLLYGGVVLIAFGIIWMMNISKARV